MFCLRAGLKKKLIDFSQLRFLRICKRFEGEHDGLD
jgi:hypothetical protein